MKKKMLVNLKDVLIPAQKGGYAVGLFNTTDTDMLEGVLAAAEELRAPVIIGTAEVLLPFGELKLIAPSVRAAAERAAKAAEKAVAISADDFDDEELYECVCPTCGDTICLGENIIEEGSIDCPNCGELLEFDFSEIDEDEE